MRLKELYCTCGSFRLGTICHGLLKNPSCSSRGSNQGPFDLQYSTLVYSYKSRLVPQGSTSVLCTYSMTVTQVFSHKSPFATCLKRLYQNAAIYGICDIFPFYPKLMFPFESRPSFEGLSPVGKQTADHKLFPHCQNGRKHTAKIYDKDTNQINPKKSRSILSDRIRLFGIVLIGKIPCLKTKKFWHSFSIKDHFNYSKLPTFFLFSLLVFLFSLFSFLFILCIFHFLFTIFCSFPQFFTYFLSKFNIICY